MTETPGSCVSENETLSQLDDVTLKNELMCALNAPITASAPPGIQRVRVFSFMKCAGKMDHHTHRIL